MNDAFETLKPLLDGTESPHLGPQRRPEALALPEASRQLDDLLARTRLGGQRAALIRSLVLLWHDHLDASHTLSQAIHSADGSFLHGIMHRREPDFGNAAYWFRKVGEHPIYPLLAREIATLETESEFKSALIRDDRWNPLALIDACEAVEVGAGEEADAAFLRTVQATEFRLLLQHFSGDQLT
jgi:hypothetical protein